MLAVYQRVLLAPGMDARRGRDAASPASGGTRLGAKHEGPAPLKAAGVSDHGFRLLQLTDFGCSVHHGYWWCGGAESAELRGEHLLGRSCRRKGHALGARLACMMFASSRSAGLCLG